MIAATKGFTRWACLILAVSLPLISTQAHAQTVKVTVDRTTYELRNHLGRYDSQRSFLSQQVWFGNQLLAVQFASAIRSAGIPWSSNTAEFAFRESGGLTSYAYAAGSSPVGTGGRLGFLVGNYVSATVIPSSVPEINAGSLSQALLILFALWLVTWRRPASRVA